MSAAAKPDRLYAVLLERVEGNGVVTAETRQWWISQHTALSGYTAVNNPYYPTDDSKVAVPSGVHFDLSVFMDRTSAAQAMHIANQIRGWLGFVPGKDCSRHCWVHYIEFARTSAVTSALSPAAAAAPAATSKLIRRDL